MTTIDEKIQDINLKHLKENLFKDMDKQNGNRDNVLEYVFNYEIVGGYVFAVAYLVNSNEYFSHIYRLAVTSVYSTHYLYFDSNVINEQSYTIEDVKKKCKAYFNHYSKIFDEIC